MLTDRDLQELLSFQADYPVLSVYLNTEPTEGNAEAHKRRLRSLLKEIDLQEDVEAVISYIDHEHTWSGRSIVLFSCSPKSYLRAYALAVPVSSRVRISDHPHVKPLADLLDSYGGYGVVLVDKQGARLFSFHLGELREQDGVLGESVRRTKRGGGSQRAGRRGGSAGQTDYVDEVTDRNIKEAVDFATHFFTDFNVRRILIGGSEENIAQFRGQLPKAWQSLVVGTFAIGMTASHAEVLEKAMEIGKQADQRREAHLVDTIVTNAAKGHGGALNLDDTLAAVREGRIQTLVIHEGFRYPGSRCKSCGYLSAVELAYCPFCGGESEIIPDVVELAVQKVMQSGGEVEVLHGEVGVSNFKEIGALLRY